MKPAARGGRPSARAGGLRAGALYAADMAFHFHCSFLAVHRFKRRVVADGRLVAWFYIRHGSFLVDLLSILPILELVPPTPPPPLPPFAPRAHARLPRPTPCHAPLRRPPAGHFASQSARPVPAGCPPCQSATPPMPGPLSAGIAPAAAPVAAAGMHPAV